MRTPEQKLAWNAYMREWRAKNSERSRTIVRKSLQKIRFGGNREAALKRDDYKCVKCGMKDTEHRERWGCEITVDHIDGAGRNTPLEYNNNNLENLMTLCLSCHGTKDSLRRWRNQKLKEGREKRKNDSNTSI